jgi:phosphomannomutase
MSELIISVSGLRGIVGTSLTPDVASRYVAAFVSGLDAGPIIVGRDGRSSGPMLRQAIIAAVTACGRDCVDADVVATPSIGVLVRERAAAGAVQITASHNPPPYNGIKCFGADGRVIDAKRGLQVRERYLAGTAAWVPFDSIGISLSESDPHAPHLEKVLDTVDVLAIRAAGFRVLLDSNHGSGSRLGVRLLKALGCQVELLGGTPDGNFSHVPEPTAENLRGVAAQVRDAGCDIGFCQDPDADRLAIVDENGRYIGEEFTLALCVQRMLASPESRGSIVINGATSAMSELVARSVGCECYRSAVGEANVCDLMQQVGAIYGGEGSGGPIDPKVGYVRDSFVGMAQVLEWMSTNNKPISELADELPRLAIVKRTIQATSNQMQSLIARLKQTFTDASVTEIDGLRLSWPHQWLLVRGSNTEPIVRLIAESTTEAEAKHLCDRAAELLAKL